MSSTSASKTIIVTGGAGFLGSHLTRRLLQDGAQVTVVDNFHTGRHENLVPLQADFPGKLRVVEADVINLPTDLEADEIYNLACPASPPHYQADPIHTTLTCVNGTLNALELARRCGARLLQTSTSEVYGDALQHPQTEDYWGNVNCTGIRSCYDEGKRCAESLIFDHHRMYGTAVKVVRIFNTYGPQMQPDDGRVVSNFIIQALRNDPITIYGNGEQTRSFCYCADLVEGLVRMMNSPAKFIGPVNLGNPGEFTIRQLAELVIELTGSSSTLTTRPLPANDPKVRRPDISLAKAKLNWQPTVPLREGLIPTIEYFRKRIKL